MSSNGWALYLGCVIPNRLPFMEKALRQALRLLEVETHDLKDFTCCPNPLSLPHLDHQAALAIAARNLAIAEEKELPILTPCNGCFETLKGAAARLNTDQKLRTKINEILSPTGHEYKGTTQVKHLVQFLRDDIGPAAITDAVEYPLTGLRLALHYGCHLVRPSSLLQLDDPEHPTILHQLVQALGAKPTPYPDEMSCCGQGTRPADRELSLAMACHKLNNIRRSGAHALVVTCPACMIQFDLLQPLALRRAHNRTPLPVFYYPELLCLALGTPPSQLGLDQHRVKVEPALTQIHALP